MNRHTAKKMPIKPSKLIQLMEVLSAPEMKRLKKFLESPFHNSNDLLVQLFLLLKKAHPCYTSPNLTKEKLFEKLFGKKPYHQQRMNDLMYDLRQLVEDFLIVSDTLKGKQERQMVLVKALAKRNHASFADESQKLLTIIKDKTTYLTGTDYLQLHRVYDQLWFHINTNKNEREAIELREAHENLDYYYVLTKLQYFAEQKERKKVFGEVENSNFIDAIQEFLDKKNTKEELPLFFLLEQNNKLLQHDFGNKELHNLIDYVFLHENKIENNLLRDLVLQLINYCAQKSNSGSSNYYIVVALDLYKFLLKKKLILVNNRIGEIQFFNIALLAYKLKKREWGDDFCINYSAYLDPNIKDDIYNLVLSYKHFYFREYEEADNVLQKISYKNRKLYYPRVKVQIIRGLYEDWVNYQHNNAEAILSQCKAYVKQIERNKLLSKEKLDGYLNFIRLLKVLVQRKRIPKKERGILKKLRLEVESTNPLTYKEWLLEKISFEEKGAT